MFLTKQNNNNQTTKTQPTKQTNKQMKTGPKPPEIPTSTWWVRQETPQLYSYLPNYILKKNLNYFVTKDMQMSKSGASLNTGTRHELV